MPSIHDSRAASTSLVRLGVTARALGVTARALGGAAAGAAADDPVTVGGSDARTGPRSLAADASVTGTVAVAIGCLPAPAKTVTSPSRLMRTLSSAPTRLRLRARMWPLSR